jgi:hypothetical protein
LADFFEPRLEPVTVLPCPFENPNIVGSTLVRVQLRNTRLAGLVSTPGPVSQSPGTPAVDQPRVFKSGLVPGVYWNPKARGAQLTEHGFFATAIYDVVIHLTVLHVAWLAPGF